ncbi:MAG: aminoacyl-tRNA hydrolase [Gammaproteobacteria bacterium]|nr:aminoacyl-tRNA hydrolase [Gammaproteobacteria bacterium]
MYQDPIKLIVGLGNPGPQYENTRHNVGVWCVHALAAKYNCDFKMESKFKGYFSVLATEQLSCKLLLPTTFMNLSGEAVLAVAHFYKILAPEILVVHDELDFSAGTIRLKKSGGANGHNGVQNIINLLGTPDFYRLRIGIGKPLHKDKMLDYVLNAPSKTEKNLILDAIDQAVAIMPDLIVGNIDKATQILHSVKNN